MALFVESYFCGLQPTMLPTSGVQIGIIAKSLPKLSSVRQARNRDIGIHIIITTDQATVNLENPISPN